MKINMALSYDDVLLKPQYSEIRSRSDINLSSDLGKNLLLSTPILSSPMDTVSEAEMAVAMSNGGGAAVIHRYNTIEEQLNIVMDATSTNDNIIIGAAVGITGDYLKRATLLQRVGVDFLCLDVAHGHHILMKEALASLRNELGEDIHLMAGNVATLEGINDL